MTRRTLTPPQRLAVFQRDAFKCRDCGASAPEVLRRVVRRVPLARGGDNALANLATSCEGCQTHKPPDAGAELADGSASLTPRATLQRQLAALTEWRAGQQALKEETLATATRTWEALTPGYALTEQGQQSVRQWLGKFGLAEVLTAMEIAAAHYLAYQDDGRITAESCDKAFDKISGICAVRAAQETKPYLRDLFYVRGILRKRVRVNEGYLMPLLENAVATGATPEWLKQLACQCRRWTQFRTEVEQYIDAHLD